MELIEYIKATKKLTDYGIAKALQASGVAITTQGIAAYRKARSMRFDVLAGLVRLSGLGWAKAGALIDDEVEK